VLLDQADRRCNSGSSRKKRKVLSELSSKQFLHTQGVIHCDIKRDYSLLDENLDLKVCDFAESSFHASKALVCDSTRFWHPTLSNVLYDAQDDIFGLGATMHDINRKEPPAELESAEVEARFLSANFPDTSSLSFDEVMYSCWRSRASIQQVCTSMEKSIRKSHESDKPWNFFGELLGLPSCLYTTCLRVSGLRSADKLEYTRSYARPMPKEALHHLQPWKRTIRFATTTPHQSKRLRYWL
jgi:serine/threonine protein kinase